MIKEKLLDLDKKQLDILKEIIQQHIPDKTVWVYGSRVTWKANEVSDIDLTVFDCTDSQIYRLKETLEESDLLFTVDVMNWEEIPNNFKTNIKKQYVVLQEKNKLTGWREVKLGEVAELSKVSWKIYDEPFPYIGLEHINENKLRLNSIGDSSSVASNKYRFKAGDILFGKLRPYFRKVVLAKFDGICSTDIWVVKPKGETDNVFLFYFFANTALVDISYSSSSGTRMPRADWTFLSETSWNLPPLPEQKAIAEVLSSLDDKIDLLHRQNKTLEDMAQTLFRQWFVEQADAGWERKKLGDFITPKKGKNITKSQAYFGVYPVIAGGLSPSCYHNKCNTQAPVITISASGANAGFVNLHHTSVWSSDSSYIDYSITPYVYFFYIFLKRNQILITDKQEGSVQPHIYPSHLMDLDVFNYSEKLIQKFENYCIDIFNKIKANQSQINTLENLRDTLLPKLMSGEVRIK